MQNKVKTPAESISKIIDAFPFLNDSDISLREELSRAAVVQTIPPGKVLYSTGDECRYFALVLSGTVRVYNVTQTGNEVTYYRVTKGQCCLLTASCVMQQTNFPAIAVAEDTVTAAIIPSHIIRDWTKKFDTWNRYILSLISDRMTQIAGKMNHLTFCSIECRIVTHLLEKSVINLLIKITHNEIAMEIGSAREVVSRGLKELEKQHLLKLSRNMIEILDRDQLQKKTALC